MRATGLAVRIVAPLAVAAAAQRRGDRAHAADRQCRTAAAAACPLSRCSSASTELFERGPRFVPSTASSASAPLSSGVSKCLLEHVEDVDAGDAQELAHVVAAEPADVEAERAPRR